MDEIIELWTPNTTRGSLPYSKAKAKKERGYQP